MSVPRLLLERGVPVSIERLLHAEDGGSPLFSTRVELLDDGDRLHVGFDCEDPEPWCTLVERDAPLWQEEVVELFLAPGALTPTRYFEFEINPAGTLFDATVAAPHGDRRDLRVDSSWNCDGIAVKAEIRPDRSGWSAHIVLPWRSLADAGEASESNIALWRANFFRVERPHGAPVEFSAWSPTGIRPADFHRPARFGILERVG